MAADDAKKLYVFTSGGKSYTILKSQLPQLLCNQMNEKNVTVTAKPLQRTVAKPLQGVVTRPLQGVVTSPVQGIITRTIQGFVSQPPQGGNVNAASSPEICEKV